MEEEKNSNNEDYGCDYDDDQRRVVRRKEKET